MRARSFILSLGLLMLVFGLQAQNVGIGTTTPQEKLEVIGNVQITRNMPQDGAQDLLHQTWRNSATGDAWRLYMADPDGGYGVAAGSFEIWEYPNPAVPGCCLPRLRIKTAKGQSSGPAEVFISEVGNVGIGTTTPSERLHVQGNFRLQGAFMPNNNPGTTNQILVSQGAGTPPIWQYLSNLGGVTSSCGTANYVPKMSSSTGMVCSQIYDNGTNVGIGTTTPAYKLTIAGGGIVFAVDNTASFVAKNAGGTYEPYLWPRWSDNIMYINYGSGGFNIRNNGSIPTMFMTNAGNVGIGTTTPAYKLTIAGGGIVFAVDNTASFVAKNAGGTYEPYLWPRWSDNIMYINYGSGGFNIRNNGSIPTMFMTNAGNVGIGTTNPQQKLEVNGYVMLNTGSTDGARLIWRGGASGTQEYRARVFTDGRLSFFPCEVGTPCYVGEILVLTQSGNVGIGTVAPAYKLVVNNAYCNGNTWVDASSIRLKENIQPLDSKTALEKVLQLQGVSFVWKDQKTQDIGLIAEEVAKVVPEVVPMEEDGKYANGLKYDHLVALLVEAIKALKQENDALHQKLNEMEALKGEIEGMRKALEAYGAAQVSRE
ncbi:MAG: tail fiber domain-containing protein [Bacteroidia bacterium]